MLHRARRATQQLPTSWWRSTKPRCHGGGLISPAGGARSHFGLRYAAFIEGPLWVCENVQFWIFVAAHYFSYEPGLIYVSVCCLHKSFSRRGLIAEPSQFGINLYRTWRYVGLVWLIVLKLNVYRIFIVNPGLKYVSWTCACAGPFHGSLVGLVS